jgi:mono/diheme cytochrome c family protein
MKLILLILAGTTIALVTMGCNHAEPTTTTNSPAQPAPSATVDEFANARVLFTKNCEACHGPAGEGGKAKVEGKEIRVPSLKSDHAAKHTDKQLVETITTGEEEMPSFKGKLKPEEIAELVKFVRKEFQKK